VNSDWTEDKLEAAEVGTEEVVVVEQLSSDQSAENWDATEDACAVVVPVVEAGILAGLVEAAAGSFKLESAARMLAWTSDFVTVSKRVSVDASGRVSVVSEAVRVRVVSVKVKNSSVDTHSRSRLRLGMAHLRNGSTERRVEVRVVLRRRRTPTVGDSWPSSEEKRVEDVLELRLGSST
jgi:hypothetical protein